jgi:fission process protein 1
MAATTTKKDRNDESEQSQSQSQSQPPPSHNIFRDSALRYAGYANEVGESFRYQIPRLVVPTYAIAFTYVCADAVSTGYETWQGKIESESESTQGKDASSITNANANANSHTRWHDTLYATADTLLWQSLASVAVPGATINLIVKASRYAVRRSPLALLPAAVAKWLPTVTGLGSIPLIVQPIDHITHYFLDNSTRHWWKGKNKQD